MIVQKVSANHYQKSNKQNRIAFGMTVDIMSQKDLFVKHMGEKAFKDFAEAFKELESPEKMDALFKRIAKENLGLNTFDPKIAIEGYDKAVINPRFDEKGSTNLYFDGFSDGTQISLPLGYNLTYFNPGKGLFLQALNEFVRNKILQSGIIKLGEKA